MLIDTNENKSDPYYQVVWVNPIQNGEENKKVGGGEESGQFEESVESEEA